MEQRRGRDAVAEIKKLQRQLADLRASSQSEHQLVIEYTETINNLEARILALRKQFEHSVRHSSLNDFRLSTPLHTSW